MTRTSSPITPAAYISRLTQGMQAKKYKGGLANKAKFGSLRAFNKFFKPLEGLCSSND